VLSFCLKNICVLSFGDTIELLLRCTLVPLNFFQHDSLVITFFEVELLMEAMVFIVAIQNSSTRVRRNDA